MKARLISRVCALVLVAHLGGMPLRSQGRSADEQAEAAAFARAQQAEKQGDYGTAEELYRRVLSRHPGQAAAELNLGLAYYMDRRYADSRAHLLSALGTKPDLFPALVVAGIDSIKVGDPRQAVVLLRRARALRPRDEYVNHNLASAEYLAEDYPDACADYAHYLGLPGRTSDVFSWYGLGEVSLLLAREASERIGELPTSNPYRLRLLAKIYCDQQEWGLALSRLSELESRPEWQNWARLEMAEVYLHQADFTHAAAEFRRVLVACPDSARAHYGLGVTLLLAGKVGPAVAELQKATSSPWLFAHPETLAAELRGRRSIIRQHEESKRGSSLVDAYLTAAAHEALGAGQPAAFTQAYQQAVERAHRANEDRLRRLLGASSSSDQLLKLAADFLEQGDTEAASEALDHVQASVKPRGILEARVRVDQGEALSAVPFLLSLLRENPSGLSPESAWWISRLFERISELSLNHVLMTVPDSLEAHLLEAQIDDAHSRTKAAIHQFELAAKLAPNDAETRFKLGETCWRAGYFKQAIAALREGLVLDPSNAIAHYEVADSYKSLGERAQALPFLREALRLDPALDVAATDLGAIYLDLGMPQRCLMALTKIAPRDRDGSVHYLLFRAYMRLGNKVQAARCLTRFRQLKADAQSRELSEAEIAIRNKATDK